MLLASGYDEHETTRRFASAGLTGFLQKPYTVDELIALVVRVSQHELASESA